MRRWVLFGVVVALLAVLPVAAAEPDPVGDLLGEDPDPSATATPLADTQDALVPDEPDLPADASLLDRLLGGASGLASDVGGALASGVGSAADAIGGAFVFLVTAVADSVVAVATGTWAGIVWSATGVGGLMQSAVVGAISLLVSLATGTFALLESASRGLAHLRPGAVPPTVWAGAVATGATAASAATNLGLLNALKRWGWLSAGGAPLFSRIAKEDVLDHPLRATIYDAIKTNPGIHISALARTVDAGWGTTIHHLRKLQEKELVAVRVVNNQKCYFQNGGQLGRSVWTQLPELKNGTANRIAQYILHQPLSPVTSISDALGLSPSLVSHHVRKLERAGVVEKIRDGRFVKLTVTEDARRNLFMDEVPAAEVPVAGVAA